MTYTKELDNLTSTLKDKVIYMTHAKYKLLMSQEGGRDAVSVFLHLMYTAALQETNSIYAEDTYISNGIKLGNKKLRHAVDILESKKLVACVKKKSKSGKEKQYFNLKLNYETTLANIENKDLILITLADYHKIIKTGPKGRMAINYVCHVQHRMLTENTLDPNLTREVMMLGLSVGQDKITTSKNLLKSLNFLTEVPFFSHDWNTLMGQKQTLEMKVMPNISKTTRTKKTKSYNLCYVDSIVPNKVCLSCDSDTTVPKSGVNTLANNKYLSSNKVYANNKAYTNTNDIANTNFVLLKNTKRLTKGNTIQYSIYNIESFFQDNKCLEQKNKNEQVKATPPSEEDIMLFALESNIDKDVTRYCIDKFKTSSPTKNFAKNNNWKKYMIKIQQMDSLAVVLGSVASREDYFRFTKKENIRQDIAQKLFDQLSNTDWKTPKGHAIGNWKKYTIAACENMLKEETGIVAREYSGVTNGSAVVPRVSSQPLKVFKDKERYKNYVSVCPICDSALHLGPDTCPKCKSVINWDAIQTEIENGRYDCFL